MKAAPATSAMAARAAITVTTVKMRARILMISPCSMYAFHTKPLRRRQRNAYYTKNEKKASVSQTLWCCNHPRGHGMCTIPWVRQGFCDGGKRFHAEATEPSEKVGHLKKDLGYSVKC